ncbi:probable flavin-containing monoamine oxidase A [Mercenaria mercenaria]|uniref:probable flavin-containing monoamine oxidase A n=1 Tax=Mercenaria mercenaria TaxID=6596 RepID=UPI00234FAA76|nr:probable flavin-containing monoamine oxidase A [Mercenaria mercenaria]XP_045212384.2 probable flavin-containing monoamine oxidase A [Mercenaria mercenaria]XP_045212385.2 probable flavin-containing monoamine oxidase A [Mercenaria mercenaria]XP_045212386.2 probable flavin-containing monoamine oxidase A [Mercenaria mercenaria]
MERTREYDIVIVGAGISGLSAARYLLSKDSNLNIVILEATDRVGGRTFTVPLKTETGTDSWDLGAHWVGRSQTHIMKLIEELGIKTHQQYLNGRKFLQVGKDNTVKSYMSDIPTLSLLALLDLDRAMKKIDSLAKEVDQKEPFACKRGKEFDGMTMETYINQTMWMADSKELMEVAIRGVIGAELSEISFLYFLTYVSSAGGLKNLVEATPYTAQEYTLQGGCQQISLRMAEELGDVRIIFREPVTSITQSHDSVAVTSESGNIYKCKKIILAIPPAHIAKIKFDPRLPAVKRELHKRMPLANYGKVVITYKEAFWRKNGCSGEVVTNGGPSFDPDCSCGPLCLVFDDTSANGNPGLVAFVAGAQLVEWRQLEDEARKTSVLKCLAQFFGDQVEEYIDYAEKDWESEPYIAGAPVCVAGPGAMRYYAGGLRDPFRCIHFAGTETATVWTGYMSGAVQAGYRAAIEILLDLRPQTVSGQDLEDNNKPFKHPNT